MYLLEEGAQSGAGFAGGWLRVSRARTGVACRWLGRASRQTHTAAVRQDWYEPLRQRGKRTAPKSN